MKSHNWLVAPRTSKCSVSPPWEYQSLSFTTVIERKILRIKPRLSCKLALSREIERSLLIRLLLKTWDPNSWCRWGANQIRIKKIQSKRSRPPRWTFRGCDWIGLRLNARAGSRNNLHLTSTSTFSSKNGHNIKAPGSLNYVWGWTLI
jgi:hypothetical protein